MSGNVILFSYLTNINNVENTLNKYLHLINLDTHF